MSSFRFFPAAFAASTILFAVSIANATSPAEPSSCSVNADCGKGYECTVVGGTACATPACAPGASCPDPTPCTPTEVKGCTPAHCAADADCADGMVCHQWTQPCLAVDCACAPNTKCDCAQPACDPQVISMCTPRYLLGCTTASDCGEGFTCEEQQSCGCSGSSGTAGGGTPTPAPQAGAPLPPDASAGGAADTTPPDCSCVPTGQLQCVAKEITCDTDASCPAGWTCEPEVAVSEPACVGANCPAPQPPAPAKSFCRPAYYGGGQGVDGVLTPGLPTSANNGSGGGTATGAPKGSSPGAAAAESSGGASNESSACQFGQAPASRGAFSLLVVLGALFGLKRRQAQA